MTLQPLPISAFIIALNEADRIALTIRSLKQVADEVIVVDSGSIDGTQQVAETHGAKVFYHPWQGYGLQKRFAEEQCKHTWLLNLDADEILSDELADEIRTVFKGNPEEHTGYTMRIYNMLAGETKIPPYTQMNTCLRLYNKNFARFSDSPVHDSVIVGSGTVAALKSPVYHPSFRSLDHAVDKLNRYSTMQAQDLMTRGKTISFVRLLVEFPAAFIKAYFFRKYIFRGARGFSYAMLYAFMRFARLAKLHEMHQMKDKKP
ncbi:MAG: glycosyltransferase family 2 protein [Alphaproteobacteria bacterium]|jgi:glycosyltransferase involved in cell wall biosynthesis